MQHKAPTKIQSMLTDKDRQSIAESLNTIPDDPGTESALHIYKGLNAFNIHGKLVPSAETWLHQFHEEERETSLLLITAKLKASRKTPSQLINDRITLYFFIKHYPPLVVFYRWAEPQAQAWFHILASAKDDLINEL